MTVFLFLGCEVVAFSLLLGAYMGSLGLGFVILGISCLIIYGLFQWLYNLHPFLWVITLLGSLTTLLWASYIDYFFGTTFIAIFLSIGAGSILYILNYFFVKNYHLDML